MRPGGIILIFISCVLLSSCRIFNWDPIHAPTNNAHFFIKNKTSSYFKIAYPESLDWKKEIYLNPNDSALLIGVSTPLDVQPDFNYIFECTELISKTLIYKKDAHETCDSLWKKLDILNLERDLYKETYWKKCQRENIVTWTFDIYNEDIE
jgi:hypothetical protein